MKQQVAFALALGLFGVGGTSRSADDTKAELKKLQGEWPVVTREVHGYNNLSELERLKIVIDGDKLIFKMKQPVIERGILTKLKNQDGANYIIKLDPSTSPKAADLVLQDDGPHKGKVTPAIYRFDKEQLWICMGQLGGGPRPDDFVTSRMPGRTLYKCQRQKPTSKEALKEAKKLAGTWVATAVEYNGKACREYTLKKLTYVISDNKMVASWNGGKNTYTFELDPGAKPKGIKVSLDDALIPQRLQGIYQLDGDEFMMCLDREGMLRPMAFETKPKTQLTLYKFKREKP